MRFKELMSLQHDLEVISDGLEYKVKQKIGKTDLEEQLDKIYERMDTFCSFSHV